MTGVFDENDIDFVRENYERMVDRRKAASRPQDEDKQPYNHNGHPNILGIDHKRLYRCEDSCIGWAYDATPR